MNCCICPFFCSSTWKIPCRRPCGLKSDNKWRPPEMANLGDRCWLFLVLSWIWHNKSSQISNFFIALQNNLIHLYNSICGNCLKYYRFDILLCNKDKAHALCNNWRWIQRPLQNVDTNIPKWGLRAKFKVGHDLLLHFLFFSSGCVRWLLSRRKPCISNLPRFIFAQRNSVVNPGIVTLWNNFYV